MRVYIAGALTGLGGEYDSSTAIYEAIAKVCEKAGAEVYLPHRNTPPGSGIDAKDVYSKCTGEVMLSDVVIADITHPSTGTGMEIMLAIQHGKRVLLLSRSGSSPSKMALGARVSALAIYTNIESITPVIEYFLRETLYRKG